MIKLFLLILVILALWRVSKEFMWYYDLKIKIMWAVPCFITGHEFGDQPGYKTYCIKCHKRV